MKRSIELSTINDVAVCWDGKQRMLQIGAPSINKFPTVATSLNYKILYSYVRVLYSPLLPNMLFFLHC